MSNDVLFVSCTRGRKEDTDLYRSLSWFVRPPPMLFFENNRAGLAARYNELLDRSDLQDSLIVFAHDDLKISDHEIISKLAGTPAAIIGLVGSDMLVVDDRQFLMWSSAGPPHLSGQILFPLGKELRRDFHGRAPGQCVVLDGMLMAMRPRDLRGVRFDPRFAFHFYDLDFCLSAIDAGLAISTAPPIAVIHVNGARPVAAGDTSFKDAQTAFTTKWRGRTFSVTTAPALQP